MAKKDSRRSGRNNLATSYFNVKKIRKHAVPLLSKQVPVKIEGVRMLRGKWVAEIKHPKKKYVRMWLGSYATQEEASKVYQLTKKEHEKINKFQAKSIDDDQEVLNTPVEYDVKSLCDDGDVAIKGIGKNDQTMEDVGIGDQAMKADLFNDRDVLSSKEQVFSKMEGVRMRKGKWVAEIKHPKKKNVRMWLGSYATQEEAAKVYVSKKMEHEKLQLQAIAQKQKLVDDHVESNAEPVSDDLNAMMEVVDFDDQGKKSVNFHNEKLVNILKEVKAESPYDYCDATVMIVDSDDQAEWSLSKGRVLEQETGDMLLQLGPILIDRYGCLLGEYSWIDDLSI